MNTLYNSILILAERSYGIKPYKKDAKIINKKFNL